MPLALIHSTIATKIIISPIFVLQTWLKKQTYPLYSPFSLYDDVSIPTKMFQEERISRLFRVTSFGSFPVHFAIGNKMNRMLFPLILKTEQVSKEHDYRPYILSILIPEQFLKRWRALYFNLLTFSSLVRKIHLNARLRQMKL